MRCFRPVPDGISLPVMRWGLWTVLPSLVMIALAAVVLVTRGPVLGVDFAGGIIIEARTLQPVPVGRMRALVAAAGHDRAVLQEFDTPRDVLIRISPDSRQAGDAGRIVDDLLVFLRRELGEEVTFRRVETVGPKISTELAESAAIAIVLGLLALMVYIWLRFEWQFGLVAMIVTAHDLLVAIAFFVLTRIQMDLSSVAAVLTIMGYSINDTVIIFDRIRENFGKFRTVPADRILERSVNENLARTVVTSLTTLVAVIAIAVLGGPVLRGFALAMIFGIIAGTWSSVFVAVPLLSAMRPHIGSEEPDRP